MAEHDQPDSAPSSMPAPQGRQNHQPKATTAQFDSDFLGRPDDNSSNYASATIETNEIAPPQRTHVRHDGALNSASYGSGRNMATSPHPIYQGKEWESQDLSHIDRVQVIDQPLKKTGVLSGYKKVLPVSASAISYHNPVLRSPLVRDQGTQTLPPQLFLKLVGQHVQTSPTDPQRKLDQTSPVSTSLQSGELSSTSKKTSTCPPSPASTELPRYMSAFEWALRPYLDKVLDDTQERQLRLPAPAQQDDSTRVTTPLLAPIQNLSNIEHESDEEQEEIPEYGIPSHLMEKDAFRTRIRQIQLRSCLMHCTVLQATASGLERTPWKTDHGHTPRWYYEKMRRLVYKAKPLAEALESKDLQARCEYWAGRGCGGTRDYQAATAHFDLALKLDVPNDTSPNGKARHRGLLPTEKADVRFLLESCSARHKAWEKRTARALKVAERQSEATGLPVQACLEESMVTSPPWMPDRDCVVQLARQAYDDRLESEDKAELANDTRLGESREAEDTQAMSIRMLNRKEWQYIKHGDVQMAKQRARQQSAEQYKAAYNTSTVRKAGRKRPTESSRKASQASGCLFDGSSPGHQNRQSLANELEGLESLEWDSDSPIASSISQGSAYKSDQWSPTSPRHLDQDPTIASENSKEVTGDVSITSASPTGLSERRHIDMDPIITEGIQAQPILGDAVRTSSPVSESLHPPPPLKADEQATPERSKRTSLLEAILSASPPVDEQSMLGDTVHASLIPEANISPLLPVDEQPPPVVTKHTSLPVPQPSQPPTCAPANHDSFLRPPTPATRTRSVSVTTGIWDPIVAPTRSQPVGSSAKFSRSHRRAQTLTGPFSGLSQSQSGYFGNCSPRIKTPDSAGFFPLCST